VVDKIMEFVILQLENVNVMLLSLVIVVNMIITLLHVHIIVKDLMEMELEFVILNQENVHAQKDFGVQVAVKLFHKMPQTIAQIIAMETVYATIMIKIININVLAIMIMYWVIGMVPLVLIKLILPLGLANLHIMEIKIITIKLSHMLTNIKIMELETWVMDVW